MSEKGELRARYKLLRKELKEEEKDEKIAEWVLKKFCFDDYFVYLSFGSEVGTQKIIEALKERGKRVCVPLVRDKDMLSVPYREPLRRGAFGIFEPEGGEETTCAAAVVPMLAFCEEGYRLGYGGGYYDRYFKTHSHVFRLGVAYEGQLCRENFSEPFDEKLDALVTEERIRLFSARAKEKF